MKWTGTGKVGPTMAVMSSTDLISWQTSRRVAARISRSEPFSNSYLAGTFENDLVNYTHLANEFIVDATGLQPNGPARVRVVDRSGWVDANIALFQRVLSPLTKRLLTSKPPSRAAAAFTGAQVGLVLGWMSTRVLGQYDMLYDPDHKSEEQDFLYYVTPNILALEKRYAFPPNDFRLWIALHECTHRAQFTGVPWLPAHFRSLVGELLDDFEGDSETFAKGIKQLLGSGRSAGARETDAPRTPGPLGYFATDKQKAAIEKLTGFMALLEGHADITMSRAAGDFIKEAERFHRVMHQRRTQVSGIAKVFQRLLGMEAKLRQYVEGASFVEAVEAAGGRDLFDKVWEKPENLPTASEIRNPHQWIKRVSAQDRNELAST